MNEVEKQKNREEFIAEVNNPAQMDNPVFSIQGQTEADFPALASCDLEQV